jgi:transglutaminase-like putative cysteine protease
MDRREFIRSLSFASAALAVKNVPAIAVGPDEAPWRTFEVTTRIEVLKPAGRTRVWVPVPLTIPTAYQEPLGNTFDAFGGSARAIDERSRGFAMIAAEWPAGTPPRLTVTSRARTQNIAVDVSRSAASHTAPSPEVARFLAPSALIPSDGIVRETAARVTRGATSDLDKARAIYSWIVENTFRDPKTRGCGLGDIRFMLESGNLGGKCADLNALYVGLARGAGLPARDVYGLRVAPSRSGYKSLGLATANASKAQHCRAEVFVGGRGWVPVDPADVRKVVLEEPPGNRGLDDTKVQRARANLFGSWEMNWIAYNFEHDVVLPGSTRRPLPFFMYPQAETADGDIDPLDPDGFEYSITTSELP